MPTNGQSLDGQRGLAWLAALCAVAALTVACGSSTTTSLAGPTPPRCQVTVAGTPASFPTGGGTGSVQVTTDRDCPWTATATASWVVLSGPTSGQGNGTAQFSVASNPTFTTRSADISINGQNFGISQQAAVPPPPPPPPPPAACSVATLSPKSQSFSSAGGTGSISVSRTGPAAGCRWTATSAASWVIVTSGSSGTGNGTVSFAVVANTGGTRATTITIAGQQFTVNQASGKTKP